jgi:phenylalanyl-tRNA synthetase beta chain
MKVPISWLKDFVDIELPIPDLAHQMTMAGLEVEEIRFVGLPVPKEGSRDARLYGIEWDRGKLVVASISEVIPHPNADRLVLCKLNDGLQEHVVLTGAPNLFEFKGRGPLPEPLKVAYAREGAQIYDGHAEGLVLTTLKRATIRGVESYSMVCSEKELGISEDHEGVIILDEDAPVGMALVDYMGDAVMEVSILPSTARCANMLGVAREIAALTGKSLVPGSRRRFCQDRDHEPLAEPAFRAGFDPWSCRPSQPLPGAVAPEAGRHAADQQYRRRFELHHAGNWRTAACLRL